MGKMRKRDISLVVTVGIGFVVVVATVSYIFVRMMSFLLTDKWKDYDECGF